MKITVIIPLRITEGLYQAQERLSRIIENIPSGKFNILIVNYGTPKKFSYILSGLKSYSHLKILDFDTGSQIFSIGHARDLGVQYAEDNVVLFNDIDFFGNKDMYERIHAEVLARDMVNSIYDFFCVPVFFLTENGTEDTLSSSHYSECSENSYIHRKIYESHKDFVEFPAYGSSAMVVNKHHYLAIGGHSREFYGHGAEDYDVLHRLSSYYSKGPRTADYYNNTKSNRIDNYHGFRAYFALYGIDVFNRGIFFQHLWHPMRSIPGYHQTQRNFSLLENLMKKFDQDKEQPFPLSNVNIKDKTLFLIDTKSRTFKAIRHLTPLFGSLVFMSENLFSNIDSLLRYINKNEIDRIFFLNPYGNEHRLALYEGVKEKNIPFIVFDRGALPDSWFLDHNGFNYDSKSYSPEAWQQQLTHEQEDEVENYLFNLRNSEHTLEHNSPRKTSRFLKELYQIGDRKVLFVPFQRPTDTVTTYFAGPAGSVNGFQCWVEYIAENLPREEWVIICKNHPLEKDLPRVNGVLYAEDDTHIHDLIDLADKVLLMNSGVGLISLAFMKPVICASNAFYAHEGLAIPAFDAIHALELINNDVLVDKRKVLQFYWHMLNRVYSFGQSTYNKTKSCDGTDRKIINEILFNKINYNNQTIILGTSPQGISLDAPLFYSFGGREKIMEIFKSSNAKSNGTKVVVDTSTVKDSKSHIQNNSANSSELKINNVKEDKRKPGKFGRKVRKLIRTPGAFFNDAIKNRKSNTGDLKFR